MGMSSNPTLRVSFIMVCWISTKNVRVPKTQKWGAHKMIPIYKTVCAPYSLYPLYLLWKPKGLPSAYMFSFFPRPFWIAKTMFSEGNNSYKSWILCPIWYLWNIWKCLLTSFLLFFSKEVMKDFKFRKNTHYNIVTVTDPNTYLHVLAARCSWQKKNLSP